MHEIIRERLQLIIEHAAIIEERIIGVPDADTLKKSKDGAILLDSLITRLQALSENIKRIQKFNSQFFIDSLPMDVAPIVRFRDLASHHYESLNHEVIYTICKEEVSPLKEKIIHYLTGE